ncbi:hypothetical protein QQ045_014625 [Rhodiola kirilowii]
MPSDSSLQFKKLKVLAIAKCELSGSAPNWLSGSANLQLLDLSFNRLHGNIPHWFGYFDSLFYLDLSNNYFTGKIPKTLATLTAFIYGNISWEQDSSNSPFFLARGDKRSLQYNQVWNFPPTLSLSGLAIS